MRVLFEQHDLSHQSFAYIAAALRESTQMRVEHGLSSSSQYEMTSLSEVVDGRALMESLHKHSSDLTRQLVKDMGGSQGQDLRGILLGGETPSSSAPLRRPPPVRIFPVYVFSLRGGTPGLAFDDDAPFYADARGAIVLQSNHESVEVSHVFGDGGDGITSNPSDVARPILDSLVRGLGNVAPPHLRWSTRHNRTQTNWMWSTGCNTNGYFARSKVISTLVQDNVRHASVLAMIDLALESAQQVLQDVLAFEKRHVHSRVGGGAVVVAADEASLVADLNSGAIAIRASATVKMNLKRLEKTLTEVAELFGAGGGRDDLFDVVAQLPGLSQSLIASSRDTLQGAEAALQCCVWDHSIERRFPWKYVVVIFFVAALVFESSRRFTLARVNKR